MAFLEDIEQVRKVNWAPKHLWDVQFIDGPNHRSKIPAQFSKWIPASDISIDSANIETFSFSLHNQSFEVPLGTGVKTITMTIFDSNDYALFKWMRDWMNKDILNLDTKAPFVSRIETAVKTVNITKLDSLRNEMDSFAYLVFPKASLVWEGSSNPEAQRYTITLVIAGEISNNKESIGGTLSAAANTNINSNIA